MKLCLLKRREMFVFMEFLSKRLLFLNYLKRFFRDLKTRNRKIISSFHIYQMGSISLLKRAEISMHSLMPYHAGMHIFLFLSIAALKAGK